MAEDPSDLADTESARALLVDAEDTLRSLLTALAALRDQAGAGELGSTADLARTLTEFSKASGRVHDEVVRYEDRILFKQKRVASAPHNFDELRATLGSKLDSIRDARGAGEFPEEPV